MIIIYPVLGVFLLILIGTLIRIVPEYERGVIFRLGKLVGVRGPGLVFIIPFWIERMTRVSVRDFVHDVTPQEVITLDNVSVSVNAVLRYRVIKPDDAIVEVEEFNFAIEQLAQTTLRSVLGRAELDEILSEREKLNEDMQKIITEHSEPWGIKVQAMEVKDVELPEEMKRAMAKQAEAERERRAKVIHAEGEKDAAVNLAEAASILSKDPVGIQLRFLQSLIEVAAEKNSTTIFPVPIDLFTPFLKGMKNE